MSRRLLWILLIFAGLGLVVFVVRNDQEQIAGLAADDFGALVYPCSRHYRDGAAADDS